MYYSYASLFGFALFVSRFRAVPLCAIPSFVICSVTSSLYIFAIVGYLELGARFLLLSGMLAIPFCLVKKFDFYVLIKSASLFAFLIFFSNSLIPNSYKFWSVDDFSHWGLAIRAVLSESNLWNRSSAVQAKSYLPGQQLFQYFMMFNDNWSEASINRVQIALVASSIIAILGWSTSSSIGALVGFPVIFAIPLTLGFTYGVLAVDVLQALIFAVAIATALNKKTIANQHFFPLLPTLFMLAILKDTALMLGLVVLALVWCVLRKGTQTKQLSKTKKTQVLGIATIFLLAPVALWQMRIVMTNLNSPVLNLVSKFLPFVTTNSDLQPGNDSTLHTTFGKVVASMWDRLFAPFFPTIFNFLVQKNGFPVPKISLAYLTVSILLIHLFIVFLTRRITLFNGFFQVFILFSGCVFFLSFHAFLYRFAFSPFESSNAASIERYFSVYLIAWMAIVFCSIVFYIENYIFSKLEWNRRFLLGGIGIFISSALFVMLLNDSRLTPQPAFASRAREDIEVAVSAAQSLRRSNESVFFLYQEPSYIDECLFNCGFDARQVFRMVTFPITRLSPEIFSFLASVPKMIECNSEFDDQLCGSDILVVMNAKLVISSTGNFLDSIDANGGSYQIFKIVQTGINNVRFKLVATSDKPDLTSSAS